MRVYDAVPGCNRWMERYVMEEEGEEEEEVKVRARNIKH